MGRTAGEIEEGTALAGDPDVGGARVEEELELLTGRPEADDAVVLRLNQAHLLLSAIPCPHSALTSSKSIRGTALLPAEVQPRRTPRAVAAAEGRKKGRDSLWKDSRGTLQTSPTSLLASPSAQSITVGSPRLLQAGSSGP